MRDFSKESSLVVARQTAESAFSPTLKMPQVKILGSIKTQQQKEILSDEAVAFVSHLQQAFNGRRLELLRKRQEKQAAWDSGKLPNFLQETAHVRNDVSWQGAPPAPGLVDRRVEITGPTERKMVINALNSGATQFMADFEGKSCFMLLMFHIFVRFECSNLGKLY